MPFDPQNPDQLSKLAVAADRSRWLLTPFRTNRFKLIQQFVGSHYGHNGSPHPVPLNMLQLAAMIYLRQLVSRAPRALVSARNPQFKPLAADMQAWLNQQAVPGMKLAETLRLWVLNALFGLGVVKVATCKAGETQDGNGTTIAVGQPFVECVDQDDWVHDMTAKRYDQVQFAGHRYRVPYEEVRDNPAYNAKARAELVPQVRFSHNERGDPRITTLSQSGQQLYDAEVVEHVELWDLWLPREQLVLTVAYQDSAETGFSGKTPLNVVKWNGPPHGPFIPLSFGEVPNQVMPVPPLLALWDLHELVNIIYVKVAQQAERQKTNIFFRGNAADDAERIARAPDGYPVRCDFPNDVSTVSNGGVNQANLLAATDAVNRFDEMAGNLRTIGGLAAQAGTLGQEELLNQNSSAQIKEMQSRVVAGTREVFTHVAWHWWTNPLLSYETTRKAGPVDVPVSLTPQMRSVPFNKLGWDIDPYSMAEVTPQAKLAGVMQLVERVLVPFQGAMAQAGMTVNYKGLVDAFVKYLDITDLDQLVTQGPPPEAQPAQSLAAGLKERMMPPNTTRTHVRRNVSQGATPEGQSKHLAMLAAGGGNPDQAALVGGAR